MLASVTVGKLQEQLRYLFRKKLNCQKKKKRILYPRYKRLGLKFQDTHKSHMCWEFLKLRSFGYVEIGVELCDECEGHLAKHFTTLLLILSTYLLTDTSMHSLLKENRFPFIFSFQPVC